MTRLYYTCFDYPVPADKFEFYLSRLPPFFQERVRCFRKWEDAHASLFGKLLTLHGFRDFNVPGFKLEKLQFSEFGKTFYNCSIDFNISHSGKYVVCAFSDSGKIGVDIEEVKQIDVSDFKKFLRMEEWAFIHKNPDQLNCFYELWTKKEAVIKAMGKGLQIPITDVIVEKSHALLYRDKWNLHKIEINRNYKSHLATETSEHPEIVYLNF